MSNPARSEWLRAQSGILMLGASLALTAFPRAARAVTGELRGGIEIGAAASSRANPSPSVGFRGASTLESNLELQLEVSALWLQWPEPRLATQLVPALAYRVDVVRLVPFARVGVGPVVTWGEGAGLGMVASGAVGLEYLWDRSLSSSLAYQADFRAFEPSATPASLPIHRFVLGLIWSSGW